MNVNVNGEQMNTQAMTIAELAQQMGLPDKGVAVAVNMQMVPRSDWNETPLQEGSEIIVIKAASGG